MATFRVSLGIGFANARREGVIEIDDEELAECEADDDRERLIYAHAMDWAGNYIDVGVWEE